MTKSQAGKILGEANRGVPKRLTKAERERRSKRMKEFNRQRSKKL